MLIYMYEICKMECINSRCREEQQQQQQQQQQQHMCISVGV